MTLTPSDVGVDVGGTWLRIRSGDATERRPAPSLLNHPRLSTDELTELLLAELLGAAPADGGRVVVSLGAAMDDRSGRVHGSAPLWGEARMERDLVGELRARRPGVGWYVHNDVTCALADFAASVAHEGHRQVGYLTVSSGIALKTADLRTRGLAVDANGLQGEVGHLQTAVPAHLPQLLGLPCECGGTGHLASVSSGPAIARVAEALGAPGFRADAFADRLAAGDPEAAALLAAVTFPVAQLVRWLRATHPLLDLVGIGGGVAEGLGPHYEGALRAQLADSSGYFEGGAPSGPEVRVLRPGEVEPIRGAQRMADGFLTVVTS
ncbi:ROK family protein [Streptomyces sp. FH025]|uniref:ROK family protein n=1 Tax=Streptomyces sp. FH025 TaxID=2815937 RepID=UPI001A9E3AF4|nr:ROK family protein [Streptomyces sp. FH025]MBO1419185.1 ROK family protein [Streptomyces sp. FH025]